MCRITVVEFTPSLMFSQPREVSIDPKKLAVEINRRRAIAEDLAAEQGRADDGALLSDAIGSVAEPAAGPGSEYVVFDPLSTVTELLAEAC